MSIYTYTTTQQQQQTANVQMILSTNFTKKHEQKSFCSAGNKSIWNEIERFGIKLTYLELNE